MKNMNFESPVPPVVNDELTEVIIGCALRIHRVLGPGFLESIYHRAICHELGKAGLRYAEEARMQVRYDGVVLGDYIVEDRLVIEIKAVSTLTKAHEIQLVNYLNAIRFDLGLLINFGKAKVEVRRKYRQMKKVASPSLHVPHVTPV